MVDKLREFVYLDDISVNSHLSSLGKALPQEVIEQSESGSETEGGADVKIAEGSHLRRKSSGTETTRDATSPYRFEELRDTLEEQDIPIHENPDPRAVSRGDVVRIDAEARPMSLFQVELAALSFVEIFDELEEGDLLEDVDDLAEDEEEDGRHVDSERSGEDEEMDVSEALDSLKTILGLAEEFIGEGIPIRLLSGEDTYVTALERSHMQISPRGAFFENKDYVVFGRVEKSIQKGEEWDPIEVSRVTGKYFEEDDPGEELRDTVRTISDELGLGMTDEDIVVEGRSVEINPIAVYW